MQQERKLIKSPYNVISIIAFYPIVIAIIRNMSKRLDFNVILTKMGAVPLFSI